MINLDTSDNTIKISKFTHEDNNINDKIVRNNFR